MTTEFSAGPRRYGEVTASQQQQQPKWAITLVDCDGYDSSNSEKSQAENTPVKIKVFKGSLVQEAGGIRSTRLATDKPQPLNYKDITNPTVWCTLYGDEVLPISEHQKELLLGVEDCVTRYLMINKLNWVKGLRTGRDVFVLMPDQTYCKAVVRYIGNVEEAVGIRFGLELLERKGEGCGHGMLWGHRYFKCAINCGMFVAMDQLADTRPLKRSDISRVKQLGDRVTCYDVDGLEVKGTVRWIGEDRTEQPVYGIEMDKIVDCSKFEANLKEMDHHLFTTASDHSKLFLPSYCVINEIANQYGTAPVEDDDKLERGIVESGIRRKRIQQSKQKLQLQDDAEIDETMLDPVRQRKILDDMKSGRKMTRSQSVAATEHAHPQPYSMSQSSSPHHTLDRGDSDPTNTHSYDRHNSYHSVHHLCQYDPPAEVIPSQHLTYYSSPSNSANIGYFPTASHDHQATSHVSSHLMMRSPSQQHYTLTDCETASNTTPAVNNTSSLDTVISVGDQVTSSYDDLPPESDGPAAVVIGSRVKYGDPPLYGVVQWIGRLNNDPMAGVELEEEVDWAGDGTFNGVLYFSSPKGKGVFVSLSGLQVDDRLTIPSTVEPVDIIEPGVREELAEVKGQLHQLQRQHVMLQDQFVTLQHQITSLYNMVVTSRMWLVSCDEIEIREEIDRGAWATLHRAKFRGATVAAKCLHSLISTPETRELFKKEMEMCLLCQHQNIVTFLGATLDDNPVMLMELMDVSLRKALTNNYIDNHHIFGVSIDVARALLFLHSWLPHPIIHGDVNSANVLLMRDYPNQQWLAKLADFGCARLQQLTASRVSSGAAAYAAPEVNDQRQHSTKLDVYSYGVVLLEMLTKTFPFQKVDKLLETVGRQFPQHHQLISECVRQQPTTRPSIDNVLERLNTLPR